MPMRDAMAPEVKTEIIKPLVTTALIQLIAPEKSSGATMTGRTWFKTRVSMVAKKDCIKDTQTPSMTNEGTSHTTNSRAKTRRM